MFVIQALWIQERKFIKINWSTNTFYSKYWYSCYFYSWGGVSFKLAVLRLLGSYVGVGLCHKLSNQGVEIYHPLHSRV